MSDEQTDPDAGLLTLLEEDLRDRSLSIQYRVRAGQILLAYLAKWSSNRASGNAASVGMAQKREEVRKVLREVATAEYPPAEYRDDKVLDAQFAAIAAVLL